MPRATAKMKAKKMNGIDMIAAERLRQVSVEGWTPAHDDQHEQGELAWAAVCYASKSKIQARRVVKMGQWNCNCRSIAECDCPWFYKAFRDVDPWPWDESDDKRDQHDRMRRLVIAGALIAAEIDRLQRRELPAAPRKRRRSSKR